MVWAAAPAAAALRRTSTCQGACHARAAGRKECPRAAQLPALDSWSSLDALDAQPPTQRTPHLLAIGAEQAEADRGGVGGLPHLLHCPNPLVKSHVAAWGKAAADGIRSSLRLGLAAGAQGPCQAVPHTLIPDGRTGRAAGANCCPPSGGVQPPPCSPTVQCFIAIILSQLIRLAIQGELRPRNAVSHAAQHAHPGRAVGGAVLRWAGQRGVGQAATRRRVGAARAAADMACAAGSPEQAWVKQPTS